MPGRRRKKQYAAFSLAGMKAHTGCCKPCNRSNLPAQAGYVWSRQKRGLRAILQTSPLLCRPMLRSAVSLRLHPHRSGSWARPRVAAPPLVVFAACRSCQSGLRSARGSIARVDGILHEDLRGDMASATNDLAYSCNITTRQSSRISME